MFHISEDLHAGIRTYLESNYPNEGGGFLIGQNHTVREVRYEDNTFETEEQYHRYLMEEGAFQNAEDDADEKGLALLGYFHSHPNAPAIPSEFDRVHALPNFIYLIVSVHGGQAAESRVWTLAEDRSHFDEIELAQNQ